MYLHNPVPTTGDNDGVAAVRREAHTRNPLTVAVVLQKKEALRRHLSVFVIHLNMELNTALVAQWLWDRRQQSTAPHLPGWCICRPQVCSRAWWSCRENQTQSDGYQQKRPRSRHPWSVRQTSELSRHCRSRVKKKKNKNRLKYCSWLHKSLPKNENAPLKDLFIQLGAVKTISQHLCWIWPKFQKVAI